MTTTAKPPVIVTAKRPRPVRKPKPTPAKIIVYSPTPKQLAAIARWERMTGRK